LYRTFQSSWWRIPIARSTFLNDPAIDFVLILLCASERFLGDRMQSCLKSVLTIERYG
jgi:hypothetical protein